MSAPAPQIAPRAWIGESHEVPNLGRVVWVRNGWRIDFSPTFGGARAICGRCGARPFQTREQAEEIRAVICTDSRRIPLADAVAQFKSQRSRTHRALDVIDRYLEAAPRIVSERTDRPLSPRTIAAYRAVLGRSRPFFAGLTIQEATRADTLRAWKAWFQLPKSEGGRGLHQRPRGPERLRRLSRCDRVVSDDPRRLPRARLADHADRADREEAEPDPPGF